MLTNTPLRPPRLLAALLGALLLAGCAGSGPPADDPAPEALVLVSLDGFGAEMLSRVETPNLDRIAAEGVRAEALVPAFPTYTFPSHYTVVTGLYPDHHGIVANTMYDPAAGGWFRLSDREAVEDPRWWGGEPIWVTAEEQGLTAFTLFWPGSEAPIRGVRPTRWMRYDEGLSYRARVDSILTWLDLPDGARPDFLTLYFDEPDGTAHEAGPASPEAAAAAARVDTVLGWLLGGLEERGVLERTDLMVTSDHGMAATSPDRVVHLADHLAGAVPLDSLRVVTSGAVAMIGARSGDPAVVESALEALRGSDPHMRVYRKEALPDRLHYGEHRRIPPIVALAEPGWLIGTEEAAGRREDRVPRGMHGYDNAASSMRAIFLARGPSFRRGATVAPLSSVHLYELMAHALGLEPAPNDGSLDSVRAVLAEPGDPSPTDRSGAR